MAITVTNEEDHAVIHLSEVFDAQTAAELTALLETIPAERRVVIDFAFLRDGRLTALVSVAGACARREGVSLRGVSEFGARILGYLGDTKLLHEDAAAHEPAPRARQ